MTDYFDHVECDLRAAVRRHAHLPWYVRVRLRHSRALVVVVASLVVAGPALSAVTLLQGGSSVGPDVPAAPSAYNGVAIKSSTRLLSLRTPDPAGGPAWGMRIIRTTRGVVCVQVGRVAFGTVGALGRDGAFGNDGRFHPFSPNYRTGPPCSVPDAHGNAFINVAWSGIPASALIQGYGQPSCTPPRTPPAGPSPTSRPTVALRPQARRRSTPTCPGADLRDVYYGLLGPDAVSITHQTTSGRLVTTPTGPDGAYVVVLRGHQNINSGGYTYDASLFPGAIRVVNYRDGHTCKLPPPGGYGGGLASCQPVGYVSPAGRLPTPAQVATPVATRVERTTAKAWCHRLSPPGVPEPCNGSAPPGFQRIPKGPQTEVVLVISWISRVAVSNGHSYYELTFTPPRLGRNPDEETSKCGTSGQFFGQTNSDYKAGERVAQGFFEPLTCPGVTHGNVTLVITTGPTSPIPEPATRGQSIGREVGHFSVTLP